MQWEWISVNDRLPKCHNDVLVTDGEACMVTNFNQKLKEFDFALYDWWDNSHVTHWMEIPTPPTTPIN